MPKLHYAGHTFDLAESAQDENVAERIDSALAAGRALIAHSKIPTDMVLGVTRLANGNDLIFSFSGSLPLAIESDGPSTLHAR